MDKPKQPSDEVEDRPVVDENDGNCDPASCFEEPRGIGPDIVEEAVRPWRAAEALKQLRRQVDAAFPGRSKANDGTIGDAAHQMRVSDHNPWIIDEGVGVVSAIDITHDPDSGCDAGGIVAALRAGRDARIKYLIWNRQIANSSPIGSVPAWTWRSYTGASPHDHHFHLSVEPVKALYDDERDWTIADVAEAAAAAADDSEAPILAALAAMGQSVNPHRPALPQLVAAQDGLTQLFANCAHVWPRADADPIAESPVPGFDTLTAGYERLFATMEVRDQWKGTVAWYLDRLRRGRARYAEVEARTAAPWWFVGIVHAMEASFSFTGHLHNGDPLVRRTVQVPKNRPPQWNPPSYWESSAVDAITYEGHAQQSDWSLERALYRFEGYNGYGYYAKGINSPYLWSFSNQYAQGKFVADHTYDPAAVSRQCGAAVMLHALVKRGDVTFAV